MTHYDMLGVTPAATQEEIETAFRKLARAANTQDDPEHAAAVRNAKYIAEAYRVLRDPERREEYARLLAGQQREAGTGAISEEEFHSWLEPGMRIEQGIAAKLAAEHRAERDRQLAQAQRLDNLRTVRRVVILVVVAPFMLWVAFQVAPSLFPESPWAYVLKYNTHSSHVHVAPKPADCDFLRAPIGLKGCHYEKSVQVTRYSTDVQSGQPIVSYDDRKTWNGLPEGEKPGRVQVYVDWEKVRDGQ